MRASVMLTALSTGDGNGAMALGGGEQGSLSHLNDMLELQKQLDAEKRKVVVQEKEVYSRSCSLYLSIDRRRCYL